MNNTTIVNYYAEFPAARSECHNFLTFNDESLLVIPQHGSVTMTFDARQKGLEWYEKNRTHGSLPAFREFGELRVKIEEIMDARIVTEFMLKKTHTFVTAPGFFESFSHFDNQAKTFRESYKLFHQYICDMYSAWYLLRLGTQVTVPNSTIPQNLRGVAIGDPQSRSNLRRCGQMIITLGECFLSTQMRLRPTQHWEEAKDVMSVLAFRFLRIGYCLLTKTMENTRRLEDDLEEALRSAQMIAPKVINAPVPTVGDCTSSIKRCAPSLGLPKPLRPYIEPMGETELPIACQQIELLRMYLLNHFNCTHRHVKALIGEGAVLTAYAILYDDVSTMASLIGCHFSEEVQIRKRTNEQRVKEKEDLAGVVYRWNKDWSEKRDQIHRDIILTSTKAHNEFNFNDLNLNAVESLPVSLREQAKRHYYNTAVNFLLQFNKKVLEVLSIPEMCVGQRPFAPFLDDLRATMKNIVETDTKILPRQGPIKVPERTLRVGISQRNIVGIDNADLEKVLYLTKETPFSMFKNPCENANS